MSSVRFDATYPRGPSWITAYAQRGVSRGESRIERDEAIRTHAVTTRQKQGRKEEGGEATEECVHRNGTARELKFNGHAGVGGTSTGRKEVAIVSIQGWPIERPRERERATLKTLTEKGRARAAGTSVGERSGGARNHTVTECERYSARIVHARRIKRRRLIFLLLPSARARARVHARIRTRDPTSRRGRLRSFTLTTLWRTDTSPSFVYPRRRHVRAFPRRFAHLECQWMEHRLIYTSE